MAEEPIFPPSGALQPVTADDFWHHERPQKTYGEYWYYEIHTDSGYRFFVNFLKTNIGLREGRCGANISIVKPGSPPRVFAREKPLKRFHEFKDKEQIWCSNPDNPEAEQTYIEGIPPETARHPPGNPQVRGRQTGSRIRSHGARGQGRKRHILFQQRQKRRAGRVFHHSPRAGERHADTRQTFLQRDGLGLPRTQLPDPCCPRCSSPAAWASTPTRTTTRST